MIEVSGLVRTYGDFIAVDGVNFSIQAGEIVGLLGHNGAGKSTVMKMLSGHLEATEGSILVDGEDIATQRQSVQKKIGYLPENLPLYSELSVIDYLHYVGRLRSLSGNELYENISNAVEATDLSEKLEAGIHTLSRGFKQRVAVAQAILGNPKVLILDEPTNGLDPTQTQHMRNLITRLSNNTTIILSTHIMQEVDAICDRALIMTQGQVALDSNLQDLQQGNQLTLHTTMDEKQVKKMVSEIGEITNMDLLSHQEKSSSYQYKLTLKDKGSSADACAKVAKSVIDGGFALYQLHIEKQDLETIFRQVNSSQHATKEVKNVA
jgi:ABC-2 type transport system ATP-binding protein